MKTIIRTQFGGDNKLLSDSRKRPSLAEDKIVSKKKPTKFSEAVSIPPPTTQPIYDTTTNAVPVPLPTDQKIKIEITPIINQDPNLTNIAPIAPSAPMMAPSMSTPVTTLVDGFNDSQMNQIQEALGTAFDTHRKKLIEVRINEEHSKAYDMKLHPNDRFIAQRNLSRLCEKNTDIETCKIVKQDVIINIPGYVGCFKDDIDRHLPRRVDKLGKNNTNQKCMDHCSGLGYDYSGTQFTDFCVCGTEQDFISRPTANKYIKVDETKCDMPCGGNNKEKCGSGWYNSISKIVKP